ncbi:hypothetical protein F4680DRAFT_444801 [Xylaria scruposa]|nr:hypothetical protein F4680DRAFT_444801 [Xylaria scruposa]
MANRGDLNLARQLQSEFSRAKPPKRKGRHPGGAGNFQAPLERQYQPPPPPPPQFGRQIERIASGRGRGRGRRAASSTVYHHPRPAWQGGLVTSDSPGYVHSSNRLLVFSRLHYLLTYFIHNTVNLRTADADQFFHRPRPSSPPPTNAQATARSAPNIRQPDDQQPTLNDAPYFSSPPNNNGTGTFGMPLYERTNQVLLKAPLDITRPASAAAFQPGELIHAHQTGEQEDIEMGDFDNPSTPAPKPTTTNPPKGLSSSMWNPANENARVDSTNSSQAKPRSNTLSSAKEVEVVTSGITKGPGLKASRWC